MSAAPATSTRDSAACTTINTFWGREAPCVVERLEPRSASAGSPCDVIHAGATPNTKPVTKASTNENSITGADGVGSIGMKSEPRNAIATILRVPR